MIILEKQSHWQPVDLILRSADHNIVKSPPPAFFYEKVAQRSVFIMAIHLLPGSVGWDCRIHQLLLCKGGKPPPPTYTNQCTGYDTKQSDGEVPVMLDLRGMRSALLLPSLQDPLWPGVGAPDRVLSMCQIELNCTYAKPNCTK